MWRLAASCCEADDAHRGQRPTCMLRQRRGCLSISLPARRAASTQRRRPNVEQINRNALVMQRGTEPTQRVARLRPKPRIALRDLVARAGQCWHRMDGSGSAPARTVTFDTGCTQRPTFVMRRSGVRLPFRARRAVGGPAQCPHLRAVCLRAASGPPAATWVPSPDPDPRDDRRHPRPAVVGPSDPLRRTWVPRSGLDRRRGRIARDRSWLSQ